jgi:hypothetical protein
MRLWKVNESDTVAGPTLLSALRAACKERGCAWWEMLDREHFKEIPSSQWPSIGVFAIDDPDNLNMTVADVVAKLEQPGIAMSSEW